MGRKDSADGVKKDRTVQSAAVLVPDTGAGVEVEVDVRTGDRDTESFTDPEPEPEPDTDLGTDDAGVRPDLVVLAGSLKLGLPLARDGLRRSFGGR